MITHFKGFVYGVDTKCHVCTSYVFVTEGIDCGWCLSRCCGIVNLATNIKMVDQVFGMPFLKLSGGVMVGAAGAFVTQISI